MTNMILPRWVRPDCRKVRPSTSQSPRLSPSASKTTFRARTCCLSRSWGPMVIKMISKNSSRMRALSKISQGNRMSRTSRNR